MHELSVCNALMLEVERIANERNASAVKKIVLRIGPLAGIDTALLQRAYPLAAAGGIAENAELVIEAADVVVRCSQCDSESKVPHNRLLCAACGDFRTRVISGDEMTLQTIELDVPPAQSVPPDETIRPVIEPQ